MEEYVASGVVEGTQLRLRNRKALEAAMGKMKDGEVLVTISRARATRSQAANRYWWGVCVDLVSEHTGYHPEEVHELAKQMFLPRKLAVCDGNGEIHGEYVVGGTTRSLNTVQFGEFVNRFRQWASSELGVVIPDPDPDYWMREAS